MIGFDYGQPGDGVEFATGAAENALGRFMLSEFAERASLEKQSHYMITETTVPSIRIMGSVKAEHEISLLTRRVSGRQDGVATGGKIVEGEKDGAGVGIVGSADGLHRLMQPILPVFLHLNSTPSSTSSDFFRSYLHYVQSYCYVRFSSFPFAAFLLR